VLNARREVQGRSIRWDEARAQSCYASGYWVATTLVDELLVAYRLEPARELIIEDGTAYSVAYLFEQSRALAVYLSARFEPGSVVSFMLPNWHECAIIYYAATMAGLVVNPILPSLREHDLAFILQDVDANILFIPAQFRGFDYPPMVRKALGRMSTAPEVVVLRGECSEFTAYGDLLLGQGDFQPSPLNPDAVRMIMYTSGTTGLPKGVMHTHNSLHALIKQLGEHWLIEPGDRFLVASPISHIGGSIYAFECPLLLKSSAVLLETWVPDIGVELLQHHRCTHFAGATPFLKAVLEVAKSRQTRLADLKVFICGGASVPPSLIYEAADYFEKARVTRVYGSTEVPVTTVGSLGFDELRYAAETDGAVGIAEVQLSNGDECEGEVLVRGPQMLVGYLHPEDEAEVFTQDGYYRTGDMGTWIDNRYLSITGRSKDIIIRNGENIAPKELEDLLLEDDLIQEVAIVGLPSERTGEYACAVVVAERGVEVDVVYLTRILALRGVAKFKFPERVELWSSLPKNDAGKVLKHQIRARLVQAESTTGEKQ
jgi:acyl-CoA synthetase (AMP-forming)/AMP-acid ligase II